MRSLLFFNKLFFILIIIVFVMIVCFFYARENATRIVENKYESYSIIETKLSRDFSWRVKAVNQENKKITILVNISGKKIIGEPGTSDY